MARYTGPACKLCRREGKKLFLKGDRCCQRQVRSGAQRHRLPASTARMSKKMREYGMQLREKQTGQKILRRAGELSLPTTTRRQTKPRGHDR